MTNSFAALRLTLLLVIFGTKLCHANGFSDTDVEWFENEVRPILAEHCLSCHSKAVGKVSGGLSFDSRADLLAGGDSGETVDLKNPNESLLVSAIRRESYEMPPEKPLPLPQQKTLIKWIEKGLPWPEYAVDASDPNNWLHQRAKSHWAWKPPSIRALQETKGLTVSDAIDQFVESKLEELEIEASPPSDPLLLLRRVYFDLTGLPPTVEQIEEFQSRLDASNDWKVALEKTVEELMQSPNFGAHWARHWLDLVRYSETMGHEFDYPIHNAWQYRDAVIRAINDDVPYDRFIKEHIAGDLLPEHRLDAASGVDQTLAMTCWWWFGDSVQAPVDVDLDYAVRIDNQIDVFSKTFLGMTIACARCHDHKFDAISAADYYGVSGILKSSRRLLRPTDPGNRLAAHDQLLAAKANDSELALKDKELLQVNDDAKVEEFLRQAIEKVRADPKLLDSMRRLDHPLSWLVPMADTQPEQAWKRYRELVLKSENAMKQWLEQSKLIADFRNGLPEDWKWIRDSSSEVISETQLDWAEPTLLLPMRKGFMSSLGCSAKSHAILQSPDFEISNSCISILARGKSVTSTIHVDGFYMLEFHQLLFGDLRKTIDSPDVRWHTHRGDLNKYLHHRGYISLEDRGDGAFDLFEIRSADSPAPVQPSSLAIKLANSVETLPDFNVIADRILSHIRKVNERDNSYDRDLIVSLQELARTLNLSSLIQLDPSTQQLYQQYQELAGQRPAPTELLTIEEGTPTDSPIAVRGNPHQLGEIAPRGCFEKILQQPKIPSDASGRMQLAEFLTEPANPLTSRVMVNRVWAKLFGVGLVATPDNLGVLGSRPSHPELLDYLSIRFVEDGWSMKTLIKEVVMTDAYSRSSAPMSIQATADPEGKLLSHRSIKRLTSESIRDTLLQFSGQLDPTFYGPSVPVHLTAMMTGRGRPSKSGPLDGANRRTVFTEVRRNFLNPFLLAFDTPLPSTTVGQRARSNVPAQSLSMLNDPFVELMSKRWVEKHVAARELQDDQRVDLLKKLFLQAYTREPTSSELEICEDALRTNPADAYSEAAWLDLVMAVVNAKEFIYVR